MWVYGHAMEVGASIWVYGRDTKLIGTSVGVWKWYQAGLAQCCSLCGCRVVTLHCVAPLRVYGGNVELGDLHVDLCARHIHVSTILQNGCLGSHISNMVRACF